MKVRCTSDTHNPARHIQLVKGQVYQVPENSSAAKYTINGETWGAMRFEILDKDEDYEPVPVTLKSPTRASNNEEESNELLSFFSRPRPGNCGCDIPKKDCRYHKDQ